MKLNKDYKNIYLVAGIIVAAFAFMAISTWGVLGEVNNETSQDIAIDQAVDKCWEDQNLDK